MKTEKADLTHDRTGPTALLARKAKMLGTLSCERSGCRELAVRIIGRPASCDGVALCADHAAHEQIDRAWERIKERRDAMRRRARV